MPISRSKRLIAIETENKSETLLQSVYFSILRLIFLNFEADFLFNMEI